MVRNLKPEEREQLDDALLSRPGEVDPETGAVPPPWWHGEDDAARSAAAFGAMMKRGGG